MNEQDAPPKGFTAALLAPITLLYLVCLLAPISYFLAVSFLRYSPSELYTSTPTLDNYIRLLFDGYNLGVIGETFRVFSRYLPPAPGLQPRSAGATKPTSTRSSARTPPP